MKLKTRIRSAEEKNEVLRALLFMMREVILKPWHEIWQAVDDKKTH